MPILILFTFISGLMTILSPCIWPILPIIFVSSGGGRKKPLGLTLGIMASFSLLTLLVTYLIRIINFDPNVLRLFAATLLVFIGVTFIVPKLSALLEAQISKLLSKLGGPKVSGDGFGSGFITGLALGSVWAPCAGPILAAIATLIATQSLNSNVLILVLFYVLGIGIPLFGFSTIGKRFANKVIVVSKHSQKIMQSFGILMIVVALGIYTGYDTKFQAKLLDVLPSYSNLITGLENNERVTQEIEKLQYGEVVSKFSKSKDLKDLGPAPEIVGISNWLNTDDPLQISELKGKVVLIDFWTYTCINCIRTLPHITEWHEKYSDKGLVIIGVHTPEFEFEKDTQNVKDAIQRFNIKYPVAQDNDFKTWRNYKNRYWPAKYLIDANGRVRYTHFGEGEYDVTEKNIQELLKEAGMESDEEISDIKDNTPSTKLTPETYIGLNRMSNFSSNEKAKLGLGTYTPSKFLTRDKFAFKGDWIISDEYSQARENSELLMNFTAGKVFLVMNPNENGNKVEVYVDDKLVSDENAGLDVLNGVVTLDSDRLYELVSLQKAESHLLKLKFLDSGVQVFAFTFGS